MCARGEEDGVKVEQGHISALCHPSHSQGKPAAGSMALPPEVVAGPGLRGAVKVQPVRIEGWKRLELPFSFVSVQSRRSSSEAVHAERLQKANQTAWGHTRSGDKQNNLFVPSQILRHLLPAHSPHSNTSALFT